jgi:4-hydroxy-tetrahydrodipicolinate reductase
VKLAVVGATGKMGRSVLRLAEDANWTVVAAIDAHGGGTDVGTLAGHDPSGVTVTADLNILASAKPDVVIDFSTANATASVVEATTRANAALVCGTTGLTDTDLFVLAAKVIPVLWEPNMSVGVHILKELTRYAVRCLGDVADMEIVEAHHRFKADSPSGTAMALLEVLQSERETITVSHGRRGTPGARVRSEVGMHAIRGGDVVGDHTVHFLCEGERLELTHRASNRDLFASGALRAAAWLAGKAPGRYTMRDVLGVNLSGDDQ